ncbi:HEAT repeat domain-containing protein [Streptomyces sp. ISL-94]|uniref:HEAT repeat domain-containing protein n=1 Tax=Streptomyces sp. ISL-94 TaxID=2819190 RepID=UPI001BE54E8F|nr:HEAT repeat domain-containing protein [Streptomyces sp. ISL-94]MBT2483011.1 HEAT repeat domain-containing protein [Streptomyces sp. ISL-94]
MDDLEEAVRAADAERVRELLAAGADPDTAGEDGLPVLCAAVAACDFEAAAALVEGGADPERTLPDGTTPLLRAVEGGSPAVVSAVLGEDPGARLPEADRARLLDAARRWYAAGAEAELRRLTGERGPARRRVVEEDFADVEEVTLGGLTVRDGYGAVLTLLERVFGVRTPVEELVARAVRHPEVTHVDWAESRHCLGRRTGETGTWRAVVALRRHPSPTHRLFAADYVAVRDWCVNVGADSYEGERRELHAWVAEESDVGVLVTLLGAFAGDPHVEGEAAGLSLAAHPDPRVRAAVPYCLGLLGEPLSPRARTALHVLAGDPEARVRTAAADMLGTGQTTAATRAVIADLLGDPETAVRHAAARSLATSRDRTRAGTAMLVALLDAEEQPLRLEAAFGLALRDDPRAPEAYARVGPLGPEFEDDPRVEGLWRWKLRNGPTG